MQEPMLEPKLGLYWVFEELSKHFDLAPWMEKESRIKDPHTLTFMNPTKIEEETPWNPQP